MAVRALSWRSCAVPANRPRRHAPWIVPVAAFLLASLPAWLGVEVGLPRPLAREFELLVVAEAPRPIALPSRSGPAGSVTGVS